MKHQFPSATPALILLAVLLAAATPVTAADADRPLTGNQAASVAPAAPTPSPGAAPTLEDQSWLLAAYRVGNALVETTEGPRPARFRFEAGRVSGNAGCNQIGGAYTLAGTSLTFKANMAATMMACPEPLMRQDQAVGLALTRVAGYRLDGELLELLDAAGAPLLRFLPLKPAPLVGQVWQLHGYNNGKQGISSARSGTEITLEFRDDDTLGGSDGCNRYMSGYTLTGEALTIGPLASTRMACKGPQGAAEQARDYAAVLGTVTGYRIDGGELTLLTREGKTAARYQAEVIRPVEVATGDAAAGDATPPGGTPADRAVQPPTSATPAAPAARNAPQGGTAGAGKAALPAP